ncbi:hypothetical protein SteCoe_17303 [Stentor coeruleus]|uniref:Uncharacterized protein n=1 Tax=Stentor coeruleus TaxID=5963 RepID=A0A1R2BZJ7_9CILI|nr:hypothetical protein SteCoe_17303 [Stentor coeruleus]
MSTDLNPSSFSAPKICSFKSRNCLKPITIVLSQGCSPSCYAIPNIPLPMPQIKKVSNLCDLSDLSLDPKLLGELSPVDSIDTINYEKSLKKSKSFCYSFNPCILDVRKTQTKGKNIFFNNPVSIDELDEEDIQPNLFYTDILSKDLPCIKLQNPPKNRHRRRKERCTFNNEIVSEERFTGMLKNYKLKIRYGFIKTENKKIFVCEDDLILSGVNLKKFKDSVFSKAPISLDFNIKSYTENGKQVLRATKIEMKYGVDNPSKSN